MKTCNFQKSTFFLLFFVNLLKFEISFSQSSCNGCVGYLDGAWCPTAGGWSKNASGGQQNVDIYIDGQLVETNFTPNFNRNDLGGMFGFVYDYPICKRDGQNHTINVKFAGTSQDLQGSPKTFNCSGGGGSCNSSLTLSTSNLSFTSGSSSQSLNVNASSTNWSATTADSWITISPSSGNNTTSVNITVQSNGGASRTGTVTFSGTGGVSNQTLTLTQGGTSNTCNGCVGYLDGAWCPTAGGWSKNASGGQQNVDVYIDGQLVQSNFSPNYNRSDVGGMFGFNYTYPNNKLDGQNHTINVKFAGTSQDLQGSPKTFNCSGGGGSASLSLSTSSLSFTSGASSQSLNVNASSTNWSATTADSWITISPSSGNNTTSVNITVQSNGGASRTGTVTFSGTGGVSNQTLTVTQSGTSNTCNGCVGYLDGAWCPTAGGWSKNASGGQQNIDIYIDGQLVQSNFSPNYNRSDVGGMFGFNYTYPNNKLDGQNHTINVKFAGTSQDLQGSPKTFNCSGGGGNNSRTSHWGTTFTEPTNWFNSQSDAYPTMIETYQNQLNQSSNQGDAIFWFYGLSNGQSYPTGPWKSMGNGYVTITLPTHSVSYITSQISKIEMELIHKATNTSVFYLYDTKGGIQGVRGNNHTKESHRWLPSGDYKVKFKNLTNNLNIRVIFQAVRQEVEGNAPTNFNEILPPLQTREFDISMPLRLDDMGDMYKMNCNAMSDDNPGFNMRIDNSSEIEVYPNPTSEKITIDLSNEDSGNVKVILSDPNGNIFKNLDFTISDNNKVLNLSPEFKEKGIYTIKIITNAKTFSKKLYFEN